MIDIILDNCNIIKVTTNRFRFNLFDEFHF